MITYSPVLCADVTEPPRRMSTQGQATDVVAMRYPQGDLAILSAETYTSDISFPSPLSPLAKKEKAPSRPTEDGPRKRTRVQHSEDSVGQEEEKKKRTRGRPRLDVKDETAADVS